MSEQTASFALMTHLCSVLNNISENVIPLSFRATREGSILSRLCDNGHPLRLIGFFPRRPKLISTEDTQLITKINAHLFAAIDRAAEVHVPIMIGLPLVASILDYRLNSPCAWYAPRNIEERNQDHLVWLDFTGTIIKAVPAKAPFEGPLENRTILNLATIKNSPQNWTEAIAKMRHIIRPGRDKPSFLFGMQYYRPCFVAF